MFCTSESTLWKKNTTLRGSWLLLGIFVEYQVATSKNFISLMWLLLVVILTGKWFRIMYPDVFDFFEKKNWQFAWRDCGCLFTWFCWLIELVFWKLVCSFCKWNDILLNRVGNICCCCCCCCCSQLKTQHPHESSWVGLPRHSRVLQISAALDTIVMPWYAWTEKSGVEVFPSRFLVGGTGIFGDVTFVLKIQKKNQIWKCLSLSIPEFYQHHSEERSVLPTIH